MLPGEGILVIRPNRREWGPVIAAAICCAWTRQWFGRSDWASHSRTLTTDELSNLPVPSPAHRDVSQLAELVNKAGRLAGTGREIVEQVRGAVALHLEDVPSGSLSENFAWIPDLAAIQGWGWADAQRHWVRDRAQWRIRSLKPLCDVVNLGASHRKTVVWRTGVRVLQMDDLRPDWYLVVPAGRHVRHGAHTEPTIGDRASRRFFEADRECLLIPTVGDITGEPLVLPEIVTRAQAAPLLIPIHWLPLAGLRYPRALAVVLDHPFVRLQRRLAGSFSTVTHITRDDVENLLVPSPPEDTWQAWESELRRAQDMFMAAADLVRQAVATVEEWYK